MRGPSPACPGEGTQSNREKNTSKRLIGLHLEEESGATPSLYTRCGGSASSGVEVDADLAQEDRRLLRRHWVDVEARPPLEAGDSCQTGNDLHVPVIMRQ